MEERIRGKTRVRSLLFSFLVPLHAMAELGGVSISIQETPIPGDAIDETHSAWTLELVGVSGKICTVSWRILRKWNESGVVLEHHYDYRQNGEPLTEVDLRFDTPEPCYTFSKALVNVLAVWQAQVKAEGTVVRRGHTIGYVECSITDEENRLVAKAASTCMALRGQKAAGR